MVEIVQRFIEAVVPDQTLAVAGSSYGGYLTLALVRTMPHRLRGVGLLIPDLPSDVMVPETPPAATILVRDDSVFADLAPGEEWIPASLVTHEARMLDAIRADDLPAYKLADYEFLGRSGEELRAHWNGGCTRAHLSQAQA